MRREDFWVPLDWFGDGDGAGEGGGGEGGDGEGDGADQKKDTDVLPGDPSYFSQISPEVRPQARKVLKSVQKPNDLVKAYLDAHGRLARSIVIPNAEKPDLAEVKALREALDIPEKEEEYELSTASFKDLPSAEATSQAIRKHAAAAALTRQQAQKTLDFLLGLQKVAKEAQEKAVKEYRDSFEARLLEASGGNEKKRDAIKNLFMRFMVTRIGDKELIESLAASNHFHNTTFAMKLAAAEARLSEEPFFDGDREQKGGKKKGRMSHYSEDFEDRHGGGGE